MSELERLKGHVNIAADALVECDDQRLLPPQALACLDALLSAMMVLQDIQDPDLLKPKLGKKCTECDEGVLELRTLQTPRDKVVNSLFCPTCKANHPLPQRSGSIRFELFVEYDVAGVDELLKGSGMQTHQWLLRELHAVFAKAKLPDLIPGLSVVVPDEAFGGPRVTGDGVIPDYVMWEKPDATVVGPFQVTDYDGTATVDDNGIEREIPIGALYHPLPSTHEPGEEPA